MGGACLCGVDDGPSYGTVPEPELPARMAAALCGRFDDCGCDAFRFEGSGTEPCAEVASDLVQGWVSAAKQARLTYAPGCFDARRMTDCDGMPLGGHLCQVYHGSARFAEDCEAFGTLMSSCEADLSCGISGKCEAGHVDIAAAGRQGDRCGATAGDFSSCGTGLACVGGRCVVGGALGQSCGSDSPCDATAWCLEGSRVEPRPVGATCPSLVHDACESGLCEDGLCAEPEAAACLGFSL